MTDTAKETTLWKGKRIGSSTGSGKHPSGIQRCFNGHLTLYGRYERYTFFISNRVAKDFMKSWPKVACNKVA